MKKIKEIIAFGDSWTMGEGWVDHPEEKIAIKEREWDTKNNTNKKRKFMGSYVGRRVWCKVVKSWK